MAGLVGSSATVCTPSLKPPGVLAVLSKIRVKVLPPSTDLYTPTG